MNIDTTKLVQILSEDKSEPVSIMVVQDQGKDKVVCLFALPKLVDVVTEFGDKLLKENYHQIGKWYSHNDHNKFLVRIDSLNPIKTSGWHCNGRPFENQYTLISPNRTLVYKTINSDGLSKMLKKELKWNLKDQKENMK